MNEVTLEQLIQSQKITGESDLDIIRDWFVLNNRESDGLSLIQNLAKSELEKVQKVLNNARMWIPNVPDMRTVLKKKEEEPLAININKIVLYYLLGSDIPADLLKWAEDVIPDTPIPVVIYVPAVRYLDEKYGIRFKLVEGRGNPYTDRW